MSHLNTNTGGLLSTYNSLTDRHLVDYFSNTRIRRHLQRAGLITRSGRIVPDKEYKHKLIQRAHQRHIRDCLAQAIFHKVMEMERIHQIEIKRNLEEFVRRERVHRMKVERSKKYKEDLIPILSPHPPLKARDIQKQQSGPEEEHSESFESPSSSRPITAPGKMQRPVRLKPIHSTSTTASLRHSSPYRPHKSPHEDEQLFHSTVDKKPRRHLTTMEAIHGISSHYLPVINNFVTPVPPVTKNKQKGVKVPPSSTVRGRRLRPATSSGGADDPPWLRSSVHQTKVRLNMVYFGKTVHLTNDLLDLRDEVKVFQQHCGGENLCVYKGNHLEGETFQFISRRHRGFPFSLTFYLNGLLVERLSSCCEFKHSKGSRLGGRHGHFGFSSVEGASPCYKCIITTGLAKKPTPPPKKEKEDNTQEQSANSTLDAPKMETERTGDDTTSHFELETSQTRSPDAQIQEQTPPGRDKVRDDYEEDFEADDEGPVEEATVEEEKSPSPIRETETLVQEENASETDDDGNDEDAVSRSGSSISSSNQEESDAETLKDSTKDEEAGQPKEDDVEETAAPKDQNEEPKSDETAAAKVEVTSDSAGDSTEIEISDTSTTPGSVTKQGDDASEDKNNEETVHENQTVDEQDRAKSVQEKLAEAILKESQCSTEPELSDTSTEEEEGPTAKDPHLENKEQEQAVVEETKHERIVTDEVAEEQEESAEAKKEEQLPDDSGSIKNDVNEVEEDGKVADDKVTAEGDKSEEPSETRLHVDDENVAQDDLTEDPFDESKSAEASENNEEKEGKVVVEADVHTDETGQKAESKKEDESPVLETDETAVTEATAASETMEIKAASSEEQEALSFEEAPETDAEWRQQADGEDDTTTSQTEVTAENSNCSPEEAAGSTEEKTANECEEPSKDESNEDEIKDEAQEQTSETDKQKNDDDLEKCEAEKMEINEQVHENTKKQKSEEEEQTHLNSEEITGENTQKTEQKQTEVITEDSKVENGTDTNENTTESPNIENEEAAKLLKAVNSENTEEEKTENVEDSECVENQSEGDDNSHKNEKLIETNTASEEDDDGAGKSEKAQNEEKVTKSEAEEKDVREGEEVSETAENHEKSDDEGKNKICAENTAESENVCDSEAAEMQNVQNITENESDEGETAGASENRAINAENGEISFAPESNPNEDEEEAPAKENNDSETTEQAKEKPEELGEGSTDRKDVEPEEAAENLKDNIFGAAPDTDLTQSSTKEGDNSKAMHRESTKEDPEPDMSEPGIKEPEEKKGDEETGGVEKGKKSDLEHENETLDNFENNSEFVLSEDQERSSLPTDDVGDTVNQLNEEKVHSVSDKNPETAADGETGGAAEEASKASEEGASVLLKPSTQNNVAEQSVTVRGETPETLTNKDNTDMVTNWIMMHQSSKYFETFVEPLEDLREEVLDRKVFNSDDKETPSTELSKSEGPLNMAKVFGDDEESRATTETEIEDHENIQDDQHDPVKAALQGEEYHVASNEETDKSDHKGDVEEDQTQDGPAKETHEKTEVGSFSGSVKAELVFGNQSGEKVTSDGSDLNPQAAADLPLTTEGFHESESPDVLNHAGQTDNQTHQITTFSTSKPADGSQEESGSEDVHPETFGDRFSGETRDVELIKDIKQFSKDHLSSFSVDRALFAHTSYPLPLTSGAESGP